MLFNEALFAFFFVPYFLAYWLLARGPSSRLWMLLLGNVLFYASWDWRFMPVFVVIAAINYQAGLAIETAKDDARKKRALVLGVALTLLVLTTLKYLDFFAQSGVSILGWVGVDVEVGALGLAAPLGISFFCLTALSYPIDVYRGQFQATQKPLHFLTTVSFFPTVSSGPILRPRKVLPQLGNLKLDAAAVDAAVLLICLGLFKKTIADLFDPTIAALFDRDVELSALEAWLAGVGYAAQLYADFSGYSDIAIGLAALLGIHIPPNFKTPFLATSFSDLWKRWHISLSTWLRDYLFLSIGLRTIYKSLFITWLLSGLWHGPSMNYVVWGLYQAGVLIVTAFIVKQFPISRSTHKKLRIPKIILTCYLWILGGILFRARSLERAWDVIVDMHLPTKTTIFPFNVVVMLLAAILCTVLLHSIDHTILKKRLVCSSARRRVFWFIACVLFLMFSFVVSPGSPTFVYMSF